MILHMTHLLNHSTSTKSGPCTHAQPSLLADAARRGVPVLDIVIPVYNEETDLPVVHRLHEHSSRQRAVTGAHHHRRQREHRRHPRSRPGWPPSCPRSEVVHLPRKGRGRALKAVWASDAAVLAYMDVDLSTDLAALLPLVAPLVSGHSDLAIGTRLARLPGGARTKRELISRGYNLLLRARWRRGSPTPSADSRRSAPMSRGLLPLVEDTGGSSTPNCWSSPSAAGLRIHEVPVDWVDDPDSRVDIVAHRHGRSQGNRPSGSGPRWRRENCRSPRSAVQLGREPAGSGPSARRPGGDDRPRSSDSPRWA